MKQVIAVLIFVMVCKSGIYATIKIAGIYIDVPEDYSVSQYDGDAEKYVSLRKSTSSNKKYVNVIFFRKNGKAEPEYSPKAHEVPLIEAYIGGNTAVRPFAWPFHYRRVFLPNVKQYIIECLTLSEFEIGNIQFTRTIVFTDTVYCYVITVSLPELAKILPKKMPGYFNKDSDGSEAFVWNSDKLEELRDKFRKHEPFAGYLKILEAETDGVIKTIRKQ